MAPVERRQGIGVRYGNEVQEGSIVQVLLAVLPGGFAHEAQRHLPYSVQLRNRFAAGLTVTPHGSADIAPAGPSRRLAAPNSHT
jgi:hypothetical protein